MQTKEIFSKRIWSQLLILFCLASILLIMLQSMTLLTYNYLLLRGTETELGQLEFIPIVTIAAVSALLAVCLYVLLLIFHRKKKNTPKEERVDLSENNVDLDALEDLKKQLAEAKELANHYKKQMQRHEQIPTVKSIVEGVLPLITALHDYKQVTLSDREIYIASQKEKLVSHLALKNIKVFISSVGDAYDPALHSVQGTVSAPTNVLKNTVQSSIRCGVGFEDGEIEKERVILYV